MAKEVKINYINRSTNKDMPNVLLFTKNMLPTFDAPSGGVSWRVIEHIGRGSSCSFSYPIETMVSDSWNNGTCHAAMLPSEGGQCCCAAMDETGITVKEDGIASNICSNTIANKIHAENSIGANLYKDDRLMMTKKMVSYDSKATFVLHPKLYWGLASEIQEDNQINTTAVNSNNFFELDLEGLTEVTVALHGNDEEGYRFVIEDKH